MAAPIQSAQPPWQVQLMLQVLFDPVVKGPKFSETLLKFRIEQIFIFSQNTSPKIVMEPDLALQMNVYTRVQSLLNELRRRRMLYQTTVDILQSGQLRDPRQKRRWNRNKVYLETVIFQYNEPADPLVEEDPLVKLNRDIPLLQDWSRLLRCAICR